MRLSSPLGNALLVGLVGLLALTLFLNGFEEGIGQYLGGIAWYWKVGLGVLLAFFVGRKLI